MLAVVYLVVYHRGVSPVLSRPEPSGRVGGRRDEIMTVSAGLFAERGFHAVSIDEIGAALGISGPAIYRHFPSKAGLLGRLLVSVSETLVRDATAVTLELTDPETRLQALVRGHVEFAMSHRELIVIQDRDLGSLSARDRARVRRLQRRYVEMWVTAVVDRYPTVEEPIARAATHAVFGLLNSTPHSLRLGATPMSDLLERLSLAAFAALSA
jgi:AcrR family transcriptional regulator